MRTILTYAVCIFLFCVGMEAAAHVLPSCDAKEWVFRAANDAYRNLLDEKDLVEEEKLILLSKIGNPINQARAAVDADFALEVRLWENRVKQINLKLDTSSSFQQSIRDAKTNLETARQEWKDCVLSNIHKRHSCEICLKDHVTLPSDPCVGQTCACAGKGRGTCDCPERAPNSHPDCNQSGSGSGSGG